MTKVLIAEDDQENAKIMSRFLKMAKFDLVFAENGQEAIDLAGQEKPDIILMDMSMPVMDGYEATQKLKASGDTSAIPVVAVTASAMPNEVERMRDVGCDDIVEKPLDYMKLIEFIKEKVGA